MPLDLSNTLVVGISTTALFDMKESGKICIEVYDFVTDTAIEKYHDYMFSHENTPLLPGTGYHLIKTLLDLNYYQQANGLLVEIVMISHNNPDTSLLQKLFKLQDRLPIHIEYSPIRIALVTIRNRQSDHIFSLMINMYTSTSPPT